MHRVKQSQKGSVENVWSKTITEGKYGEYME